MASDGDLECSICIKSGQHREAKAFCQDCEGYICSSCKGTHEQFPALRNHNTISTEEMKKTCGICKSNGKEKDARCFCKDCDAWLCDDCRISHKNFRDLQRHTIVTNDALICPDSSAPSDIASRLEQLSTNPSEDSAIHPNSETQPQEYGEDTTRYAQTNPSEDAISKPHDQPLADFPTAKPLQVDETLTDSPTAKHGGINILRYKANKKMKKIKVKVSSDRRDCSITGSCFMPGGELVICDYLFNNKVKLLSRSLSLEGSLEIPGRGIHDVAAVDSSNVIVSNEKQLQFIQVLPSLKLGRTIDAGELCWGVAVAAGKIFVSCHNLEGRVGDIRVFDIDGKDLGKRIGLNHDGSSMFRFPEYVAVSRSGDKIFVSDSGRGAHTVTCLTIDGQIVYQYRDAQLLRPQGIYVDDYGSVIVCGESTIQVLTPAGIKFTTLLSSKDGISEPDCVSFRPSDGTLVVGVYGNKLLVNNMQC